MIIIFISEIETDLTFMLLLFSYSNYLSGATGYTTWTKKTSSNTATPRATPTVTPSTNNVEECPIVWRSSWPSTGMALYIFFKSP